MEKHQKRLFLPANRLRSTCLLVEIHNIPYIILRLVSLIRSRCPNEYDRNWGVAISTISCGQIKSSLLFLNEAEAAQPKLLFFENVVKWQKLNRGRGRGLNLVCRIYDFFLGDSPAPSCPFPQFLSWRNRLIKSFILMNFFVHVIC